MASKNNPIQRTDISVDDPFKLIKDSAQQTLTQVAALKKDLEVILPITKKLFEGKASTIADLQAQEKALKKLNDQTDRAFKLTKEKANAEKAITQATAAEIRLKALQNREAEKSNKLTATQIRQQERLSSTYLTIDDNLKRLIAAHRELAIRKELGEKLSRSEERSLQRLTASITTYDKAIKKVDEQVGRHQRSVGQYGKAFNGLSFSLAQITREAPAFANSLSTGFMAISNNIPMFVDEITKLKTENQNLAKEGLKTKNIFSQIATSIFSFQTLLSVGVTLLTLYGAEMITWVGTLFEGKDAMAELNEQRRLGEIASKKMGESISKETSDFIALANQLKNTNKESEERVFFINKINELYGTTLENLSDELSFQVQINQAIERYIALARIRFRLDQDKEKTNKLFAEEFKLTRELELANQRAVKLAKERGFYNAEDLKSLDAKYDVEKRLLALPSLPIESEEAQKLQRISEIRKRLFDLGNMDLNLRKQLVNYGFDETKENEKQLRIKKEKIKATKKEVYELSELILKEKEYSGIMSPERLAKILSLEDERALRIVNIAVIEAELALLQANKLNDLEAIRIAEEKVLEVKIKQIEIERDIKIKNQDLSSEKEETAKEAELEIERLKAKGKETDKEIDKQKELAKLTNEVLTITKDYIESVLQAQIKALDDQINRVNKSYSQLEERASKGNLLAQESIKEQMRLEQELIDLRTKKANQLALVGALASAGNSFLGGGNGGSSLGALISSIQGFETGTEGTIGEALKPNLRGVGKDDTLVRVHGKERVINESLSSMIQGHKTSDVIKGFVEYERMKAYPMGAVYDMSETNAILKERLEPQQSYDFIGLANGVASIVKEERFGNSRLRKIHKIKAR